MPQYVPIVVIIIRMIIIGNSKEDILKKINVNKLIDDVKKDIRKEVINKL